MTTPEPDLVSMRFSTEALPEAERVPYWREVYGKSVVRMDIEPLPGVPFFADLRMKALPGLALVSAEICGTSEQRTRALLVDGNDDIALAINLSGPFLVAQRGREYMLGDGDAVATSCDELGKFIRPSMGHAVGVCIPRAALQPFVRNLDDAFGPVIPRDTEAVVLLKHYIVSLSDNRALATPELRRLVVTHIHDLVAVAIGATKDAMAIARDRGVRAARLKAIKLDIGEIFARHDLTVNIVAARHRVTPRYVQLLFESEGTTFSAFLLDRRLAMAYRLLIHPRRASQKISAIAYEVGFSDLSYFNHAFRQRYDATPSDIRAAANREG